MKKLAILPLILIGLITVILWRGMGLHPNQIPTPLLNKALPIFKISTLADKNSYFTAENLKGHITLLNVWATWCEACRAEHAFLLQLAETENIEIAGLDYKDDPRTARDWLQKNGNPYFIIGSDTAGSTAIDWGVYGTPETFILDKHGIVRYKHIGPLTEAVWQEKLKPLIDKLQGETA